MHLLIPLIIVAGAAYLFFRTLRPGAASASGLDRLRRLEDVEEIRRLLIDYGRHLDRRDFAAYAALFASDGVWDGGFGAGTGPAEIRAMMERTIGGELNDGPQRNYHLMSSLRIEVDGDTGVAWSRWSFILQDADHRPRVAFAGRYDDQLARESGRWKFKLRKVSADLPGQAPPSGPLD